VVNAGLNGVNGKIEVVPYTGDNPLLKHGPVRVADNQRRFTHADGTPFLWLGDTWWKCLCKRMTWEGFQELTADRKAKGIIWEKSQNDAGGCASIHARSGASREYVT